MLYRDKIPALVFTEDFARARTATGALRAYEEILNTLQPGAAPPPVQEEEPFVDPATRFSVRRSPPSVQKWQDSTLGRRP